MNLPRYIDALIVPAALMALAGCSSFRTEMGRPLPAPMPQFAEGRTPVAAVVHELGPPNGASKLGAGFVFLYEYSRMGEFQLGISLNLPVIRYLKFVHARNDLLQEALILTFDDRGILLSIGTGQWKEDLGGGTGVQILFVSVSLSDVSKILRPGDAHDWGEALLQPVPEMLNAGQSLHTGQNGLQLRITTDYAGQHTLEMARPKTERQKKRAKKHYQTQ